MSFDGDCRFLGHGTLGGFDPLPRRLHVFAAVTGVRLGNDRRRTSPRELVVVGVGQAADWNGVAPARYGLVPGTLRDAPRISKTAAGS